VQANTNQSEHVQVLILQTPLAVEPALGVDTCALNEGSPSNRTTNGTASGNGSASGNSSASGNGSTSGNGSNEAGTNGAAAVLIGPSGCVEIGMLLLMTLAIVFVLLE
jgi:hypothetical protein